MKIISGLFFVVCLFCAVVAFPTSNFDDDAEVVVVPLEAQQGLTNFEDRTESVGSNVDGVVATDFHPSFFSITPINPSNWNFGFFDRVFDIVRQLRERVDNAWSEPPVESTLSESESAPNVKSNSTSRVEYIDGRKVVINETFHQKDTDFGTSVFSVRVIDFLPLDDDAIVNTSSDPTPESEIEIVSKTGDDELEKGSPEELDNNDESNEILKDIDDVENFELDDDNNQQQPLRNQHQHHHQQHEQQQQQQQQREPLEEQNYTNNRLEEFMPNSPPSPPREQSWESAENEYENIDLNEHYPVDLSNDIAVNQMAADQGVPYDSDAEIFSVNEHAQYPLSTTYDFVPSGIRK